MVRLARKRGVPIVACTLPRNYRDMPPRKTLPLGDKGFFDAWEAWERKDLEAAIRLLRAYLQRQPEQPHAHYLLARAMESAGNASAALSSYVKAVDLEGALPSLNAVARKVCLEEGCILADVEASFNALNPNGLADGFCFDDEMHWDRFCDPLVTKTIEKAVCDHDARHGKSVLAERLPWDQAALGRALTLTPTADALRRKKWEIFMIRVWNEWEDEERYFERVIAHFDHMRLLDPGMVSNVSGLRDFLRTAFQSNRWDRTLADNVDRWWPQMLRHVGEMYRRNGQDELALRYFDETALLAPGPRLFRLSRALALSKLGRDKEAWAELDQLAALEKRFKEIRYYRETLANARRDAPRTRAAMPPPGRMIRASRRLKQQEEIEALRKEARRILEAPRH